MPDEADRRDDEDELQDDRDDGRKRLGRKLGENILSSLIDSGRRGQDMVQGVAQGTKEEVVRIVGQELRGFLDKMDMADLVQEIVAGLVVEIKTEIRFSRDESGALKPNITKHEAGLAKPDEDDATDDESSSNGADK